jgi:hypothetical protein
MASQLSNTNISDYSGLIHLSFRLAEVTGPRCPRVIVTRVQCHGTLACHAGSVELPRGCHDGVGGLMLRAFVGPHVGRLRWVYP